jgi:hypothetical protein
MKTTDVGNMGMYTQVGMPGIARWGISYDGKNWLYLRNYNYSTEGDPSGTLFKADFPSGANETMVMPGVAAYQQFVDATLMSRGYSIVDGVSGGVGTFKILKDLAQPATGANLVTVIAGTGTIPVISPDFSYALYSKTFDDMTGLSDFHIVKTDGTGSCVLAPNPTASFFGSPFSSNGKQVYFVDAINIDLGVGQGYVADPAGCGAKTKFADNLDYWFFAGDEGLVYTTWDGTIAGLLHQKLTDGKLSGTPTAMIPRMERGFGLLRPASSVLWTLPPANAAEAGLYVSTLPFTK